MLQFINQNTSGQNPPFSSFLPLPLKTIILHHQQKQVRQGERKEAVSIRVSKTPKIQLLQVWFWGSEVVVVFRSSSTDMLRHPEVGKISWHLSKSFFGIKWTPLQYVLCYSVSPLKFSQLWAQKFFNCKLWTKHHRDQLYSLAIKQSSFLMFWHIN